MKLFDSLSGLFFNCPSKELILNSATKTFDNDKGYFYTTIADYYDWLWSITNSPMVKILKHKMSILYGSYGRISFDLSTVAINNLESCLYINIYIKPKLNLYF